MTTTAEAVQQLADIFADAELKAREIKEDFRGARKLLEILNKNGATRGIETQASAAAMDSIATGFESDLWALHADLTAIAQERGIDLPALRSGGGGR